MTSLEHILPLWHELESAGAEYVLATVVAVEGSNYRRPGARMLLAQDGRRAGTVSGGCLEAEVARRAWWLTANGPVVERYSTIDDDGDMPYGSGCGGAVFLLLERRATAAPLLSALESAFQMRAPLAIATVLAGPHISKRAFAPSADRNESELARLARRALMQCASFEQSIELNDKLARVFADYRAARPGLWIFGAGDDARPLLALARELGWFVAVADGRSNLATRERFTAADEVRVLSIGDWPNAEAQHFSPRASDAAIVMTHSFEQDSRILATLLAHETPLAYIGVLGPQRRTRELLLEAARLLHLPPTDERVDRWLAHLYAPTGLDLGAETPPGIALSILAEIQKVLNEGTGRPLREVRAMKLAAAVF
jgi:xanthine/CO dehydrogenase XdhC/CoxF family maturation factor